MYRERNLLEIRALEYLSKRLFQKVPSLVGILKQTSISKGALVSSFVVQFFSIKKHYMFISCAKDSFK